MLLLKKKVPNELPFFAAFVQYLVSQNGQKASDMNSKGNRRSWVSLHVSASKTLLLNYRHFPFKADPPYCGISDECYAIGRTWGGAGTPGGGELFWPFTDQLQDLFHLKTR